MNGHTDAAAGLEPVDTSNAVDHGARACRRHADILAAAKAIETQGDGDLIEAKTLLLAWVARNPAPGEGEQGGEGVGQENEGAAA